MNKGVVGDWEGIPCVRCPNRVAKAKCLVVEPRWHALAVASQRLSHRAATILPSPLPVTLPYLPGNGNFRPHLRDSEQCQSAHPQDTNDGCHHGFHTHSHAMSPLSPPWCLIPKLGFWGS